MTLYFILFKFKDEKISNLADKLKWKKYTNQSYYFKDYIYSSDKIYTDIQEIFKDIPFNLFIETGIKHIATDSFGTII